VSISRVVVAKDLGLTLRTSFLDVPCTSEMLSRGANPDVSGPRTKSPLCRAMINGNEPLAELLLAHGAKLEPDLLFVTTGPRRLHGERMTKFLLDHGVNPNTTSAEWGTPLHLAVSAKKPNIIKLLLDAGADRSMQSTGTRYTGQTPLQIAQMYSMVDPAITEIILSLLQS
jgi:ankyrin repeat protein